MNFKIRSLEDKEFSALFSLNNLELEKRGAIKMIVDKFPGFPCRVSLEDAEIGEEVILIPYQHHKTSSPYQASGPIFVREGAKTSIWNTNEIPKMLNHRLLSLRGYNDNGIMKKTSVTEGNQLKEQILRIFGNEEIKYIDIHNAGPGCYNCRVERI